MVQRHKYSDQIQLLLSFVLPFSAFLSLLLLLQITPFGDKTFLYDDMKRQYVDYYSYYKNILLSRDDFFYSFSNGLGGEMFSSMAYYLLSPLLLPFVFLPRAVLPAAVTVLIGTKLCLCSVSDYVCLRDLQDSDHPLILALSFAYAFNAYTALNASNVMWLDVVAIFPLLLMATRWMLAGKRHSGRFFTLLLCASLIMNFYITYMAMLCLGIYVLLHARSVRAAIQWGIGCAIAAATTAIVMLPTFLALMDSGKNTTRFGDPIPSRYLSLGEILSKALSLSTDSDQVFTGNPHIYCGLAVLFGLVLYLLNRRIPAGQRVRMGILMAILVLSMMLAPVNRIWHGFASPEGFLYRFSFLLIFLALECSWMCVNAWDGVTLPRFLVGCSLIAAFLIPVFYHRYYYLDDAKKMLNLLMILVLVLMTFGILLLQKRTGKKSSHVRNILVWLVLLMEMADVLGNFAAGYVYASYGQETNAQFTSKTAADGAMIAEIEAQDPGFYRIENESPRSENDAFQYNTNGVNVYTSMTPIYEREFMRRLGYNDNHFFATYTTENMAAADAIFGVRYMLQGDHWTKLQASLPIFLASDRTVEELAEGSKRSDEAENPFRFAEAILETYLGEPAPIMVTADKLDVLTSAGSDDSAKTDAAFELEIQADGVLYFYLQDLDHTESMNILVDGKQVGSFGNASNTKVCNLGRFSKGEHVKVQITNIADMPPVDDFLFETENEEKLEEICRAISAATVDVRKEKSSHLLLQTKAGDVNARALVMAIPYEQNWTIRIDGRKTEPIELFGAYMALPLPDDGTTHTIDLRYWPRGFRAGAAISAVTVLGCILYLLWKRNHENRVK